MEATMSDHIEANRPNLTAQELGSLLGKMTRKIDKPCLECQMTMRGVTIRREFCSARCRQRNWLRRLNELEPGESITYVRRRRGDPVRTATPD